MRTKTDPGRTAAARSAARSLLLSAISCAALPGPADDRDRIDLPPVLEGAPTLVGAGDIAVCGEGADDATARLLDRIPGTVFTAGDHVYGADEPEAYGDCYGPTWGRHLARTRPAPGNHDYRIDRARGYFDYFGDRAGTAGEGWYAFDLGTWRVVVLNSNCAKIGGCGPETPQLEWLARELASSSDRRCQLAIFHHARFSSGHHGPHEEVSALWELLHRSGADVVVNGHDHSYERLAPVDARGEPDPARGIRSFVVGTGGAPLHPFSKPPLPITEVRDDTTFGVLSLRLGEGRYDWAFHPATAGGARDAGSAPCHD